MKEKLSHIFITLIICFNCNAQEKSNINSSPPQLKPRLLILTDITIWEPDDHESLIRLLAHADLFEIEGIVVTTGWSMSIVFKVFKKIASKAIDAYEQDLPNLLKRSEQNEFIEGDEHQYIGYWPDPQYLRDRLMFGSLKRGMRHIGPNNYSEGSNLIIELVDENDERPLWVSIWGGGNTLAQSIWQIQQSRSEEELKKFLNKIRAYAITDQDISSRADYVKSSHSWMRHEFEEDLFFIWDECAWEYHNNTGKKNWDEYKMHIKDHGNLGKRYPRFVFGVEGDTPAFLHVLPNGLNDPEKPNQAGWGGIFERGLGLDSSGYSYTVEPLYCHDFMDHFYPAMFNNFAARMDWAKHGKGNRNPIAIIDGDRSINVITKKIEKGSQLELDASQSFDPENDLIFYNWWIQEDFKTPTSNVQLLNHKTECVTIKIPSEIKSRYLNVICEITDNGTPNLTSYRRMLVEIIE